MAKTHGQRGHHLGAVCVALALTLAAGRTTHAEEVAAPTALELLLTSAGFTLGAELPTLVARCTALGSTLVRAPHDMMRCALPGTEGRLPMLVSIARMPNEPVLGYVVTSVRAPAPEALLETYEAARAALVARYRNVAVEVEPRSCAAPSARTRCMSEGTLESVSHLWTTGPGSPNGRPRGDASRLRADDTEDLTLKLQPSSEGGWQLALLRTRTGYAGTVMDEALRN
jgi:hypothetical protein